MNAIHGKISVPQDIVNLVKDIRNICPNFKEVSIAYCLKSVIELQIGWPRVFISS